MSESVENLHSNSCAAESMVESENNGPYPKSARLSPPPKRSRRSVQKRVVSIPIPEAGGGPRAKGAGECSPPADSWAWRKYGQKPIKGSPFPRGYYRCSSSKGCPARKQVERSSADPTTLLVTYTCEHNHAWPLPKSRHVSSPKRDAPAAVKAEEDADPDPDPEPVAESGGDQEESRFSDLIGDDAGAMLMMPDDFWYSDVGSTSSTSPPSDTLLYGPIFVGSAELAAADLGEKFGELKEDDEDALFAGLGELPEYSTVFRRSYLERPMALHTAVHQ